MVNQRDVARRAGVSPRTVSNVLRDFHYVSEPVRARVRAAMDELGYRPNIAARQLRQGRTGLLTLVVPFDAPYFAELSDQVIKVAREHGLTVVIDKTDGDPDREREMVLRPDRTALFDGLIFSLDGLDERELTDLRPRLPMVLLGERADISGEFDRIVFDNLAAARAATEHLLGLGRRRIALIRSGVGVAAGPMDRHQGYLQALEAAGLPADEELIKNAPGTRADGYRAMLELMAADVPPDAVVCHNDPCALGAIRALLTHGYRVPEDVAVVGFDDITDGRYSVPSLTTIAQDREQIARRAVETIVARLDGDAGDPTTVWVDWELIARESTLGRSASPATPE
ncbi:LacI family DNA-binding transcriptional regulator [Microlunatus soli]|uniref:DNA-binding transcriptional regulator, LacI/PurR family n=1 Tax=Microlunatus soli TaxID=630515 RepID=A0A1H1U7P5_9ACTN|nr:LacI family DNA-binding transcriptional regulator [Microlunatus soli]SDS68500.1 DNA-binding transcriptional regulator, LacI/PurR family [Microlunatus soli]